MSTAEATLTVCPVCNTRTLAQHCDSKTCNWHKCRSRTCEAVLDLTKRRGYAPEGNGFRRINLA